MVNSNNTVQIIGQSEYPNFISTKLNSVAHETAILTNGKLVDGHAAVDASYSNKFIDVSNQIDAMGKAQRFGNLLIFWACIFPLLENDSD